MKPQVANHGEITLLFSTSLCFPSTYMVSITALFLLPFLSLSLPGPLVSPNSVPNNLDGNKAVERRPSKAGVSRESSSVDFSKVT